jgi:NAD(P)-dependent dehydrogenase (short-subunit alcohol dehydrogenase family)
VPGQRGRTVVVTGANGGLGLACARALAHAGATVVLACRDPGRADRARAAVAEVATGPAPSVVLVDLADLSNVRAAARVLAARHPRLDVLLNNAGIMAVPYSLSADGFERQFAVNHLGHFVWTLELLPRVTDRVVNVSSDMIRLWPFDLSDRSFEARRYARWPAYVRTKVANVLFTRALASRLPQGAIAVSTHPGFSATELQQGTGSAVEGFGMRMFGWFVGRPPSEGARPLLRACTDPEARQGDHFGVGGLLAFGKRAPVVETLPARLRDPDAAERLWALSVAMTHADLERSGLYESASDV